MFKKITLLFLASTSTALLLSCNFFDSRPVNKNVVLIIVDTLAVQHLGAYNSEKTTSPNIDLLARNGTLFERAYSPAPWTKPAVSSVFTGVMPSVHGVKSIDDILSDKFETMAERLKAMGYQTAGFVSHTLISPKLGYSQGFDRYETIPFKGNVHSVISSEKVTGMGLRWLKDLKERGSNDSFFLFLHYFDPHNNYQHHKEFDRSSWYKGPLSPGMDIRAIREKIPILTEDDKKYLRDLYDEEIAHTDTEIGKLLTGLQEFGFADNTLVILTADHGEEFFDHGSIGHSRTLYDELTRVPLIFNSKNVLKQRLSEAVTTVDIAPTVIDIVGGKTDPSQMGISLKENLISGKEPMPREIISEVDFKSSYIKAYKISAVKGWQKGILDKPTKNIEVYDLKTDPKEISNIVDSDPKTRLLFTDILTRYEAQQHHSQVTATDSGDNTERSPEEIEQLKSLGYL